MKSDDAYCFGPAGAPRTSEKTGRKRKHAQTKQETPQMQRYRATPHKYELSHLKRLAIGK